MDTTLTLVDKFHRAFDITRSDVPHLPSTQTQLLRIQLIQEELAELTKELGERDMVAVLDALCDLRYVLDGTTISLGLQHVFLDAMIEVHRSNMSKLDEEGKPIFDESGKVMKGPSYSRPDLKPILDGVLYQDMESHYDDQD